MTISFVNAFDESVTFKRIFVDCLGREATRIDQ